MVDLYRAEALFDYEAVEETELDIKTGDIVTVEENNDSGWSLVRLGDKTGWVPSDYVEQLPDAEKEVYVPPPAPAPEPEPEPEPVYIPEPAPPVMELEPEPVYKPEPQPVVDIPPPPAEDTKKDVEDLNNTLNTLQSLSGDGDDGKKCHGCNKTVGLSDPFVVAKEMTFHAGCFSCCKCNTELGGKPFIEKDKKFYCENDYYDAFSPKCGYCDETIKGQYISALDQSWHPDHFLCTECDQPFVGNQFRKHDNKPYCEEHYKELFASTCAKCSKAITGQVFEALDKKFHLDCFVCEKGEHPIGEGNFHFHEKKVYCPEHFGELFLQKCAGCDKVIAGQYLKIMDQHYHPDCWTCTMCKTSISANSCAQYRKQFYCKGCIVKARTQGLSQAKAPASTPKPKSKVSTPVPAPVEIKSEEEEEEEGGAPELIYSYEALKNKTYDKDLVDVHKLEMYLEDSVFERMFGMKKAKFAKLPKWKQKAKKRNLQLF